MKNFYTKLKAQTLIFVFTFITFASAYSQFNCGSNLTDSRDGKVYRTVKIGTQCWMKDNLNIGEEAYSEATGYSHSDVTNNGVIEKYCYGNNDCSKGGFYGWDEMMNYTTIEGGQGICPNGWHVPTDFEWYTLENYLDPTIQDGTSDWRGTNGGTKLKVSGSSGFDALLIGARAYNGEFSDASVACLFWTSTYNTGSPIMRWFKSDHNNIWRSEDMRTPGYSVRCLLGDGAVGIKEVNREEQFRFSGNPVSDRIMIVRDKPIEAIATIYDATGRLVKTTKISTAKTGISTAGFSNGVYILRLQTKTFAQSHRIVISR